MTFNCLCWTLLNRNICSFFLVFGPSANQFTFSVFFSLLLHSLYSSSDQEGCVVLAVLSPYANVSGVWSVHGCLEVQTLLYLILSFQSGDLNNKKDQSLVIARRMINLWLDRMQGQMSWQFVLENMNQVFVSLTLSRDLFKWFIVKV